LDDIPLAVVEADQKQSRLEIAHCKFIVTGGFDIHLICICNKSRMYAAVGAK